MGLYIHILIYIMNPSGSFVKIPDTPHGSIGGDLQNPIYVGSVSSIASSQPDIMMSEASNKSSTYAGNQAGDPKNNSQDLSQTQPLESQKYFIPPDLSEADILMNEIVNQDVSPIQPSQPQSEQLTMPPNSIDNNSTQLQTPDNNVFHSAVVLQLPPPPPPQIIHPPAIASPIPSILKTPETYKHDHRANKNAAPYSSHSHLSTPQIEHNHTPLAAIESPEHQPTPSQAFNVELNSYNPHISSTPPPKHNSKSLKQLGNTENDKRSSRTRSQNKQHSNPVNDSASIRTTSNLSPNYEGVGVQPLTPPPGTEFNASNKFTPVNSQSLHLTFDEPQNILFSPFRKNPVNYKPSYYFNLGIENGTPATWPTAKIIKKHQTKIESDVNTLGAKIVFFDLETHTHDKTFAAIRQMCAVSADGSKSLHSYIYYKNLHKEWEKVADFIGLAPELSTNTSMSFNSYITFWLKIFDEGTIFVNFGTTDVYHITNNLNTQTSLQVQTEFKAKNYSIRDGTYYISAGLTATKILSLTQKSRIGRLESVYDKLFYHSIQLHNPNNNTKYNVDDVDVSSLVCTTTALIAVDKQLGQPKLSSTAVASNLNPHITPNSARPIDANKWEGNKPLYSFKMEYSGLGFLS